MTFSEGKRTCPNITEMMDLDGKDFKAVVINRFKELNNIFFEELRKFGFNE